VALLSSLLGYALTTGKAIFPFDQNPKIHTDNMNTYQMKHISGTGAQMEVGSRKPSRSDVSAVQQGMGWGTLRIALARIFT
jgi:hypothetical protein